MEAGSGSKIYWALLFGRGLSSMVMVGRLKYGLPKPTGKELLKQS